MILFFKDGLVFYAVESELTLSKPQKDKLSWLFGEAEIVEQEAISGQFVGPRKEMITPWSTNAVEIAANMGIAGIRRIERFTRIDPDTFSHDPMLQSVFPVLDQDIFEVLVEAESVREIQDIAAYNDEEGLALSQDEIEYLNDVSEKIGRSLTDSEVFGFSQVNSEHCRHKIFNGTFIIDGVEMKDSLFALIKKTSQVNPNQIVSAYKDNVAFVLGPQVEQFAPERQDQADFFSVRKIDTVLSLKAETHNFPTTVEPFNGAATGSGGEIRDRMAGGKASIPLMGTAVYMTSYPRLQKGNAWESSQEREWLYQSPSDILVKASNGASDFGNKFGQPLLCGSLLTFEHKEHHKEFGYDKVIMLAGGVGFGKREDSLKDTPEAGDVIVVLGGDNYRIGMGGGAVSSVATGEYGNAIELNAIQRSNPEMQKRVYNAIRAMTESTVNPIVSLHDHGAGGHLNCLSELVEETGGEISIDELPVGDPTLSAREIIGNESQERMGLVIRESDYEVLRKVSERERAPIYKVGKTTGDQKLIFDTVKEQRDPINIEMPYLFGKPPKTILEDHRQEVNYSQAEYSAEKISAYIKDVLRIEAVACKDWLTNKVDRSVTGKGVVQQCAGEIQLPVNDLAVVSIDYLGTGGIATSIGHAPVAALADASKGSRLAISEALTNMIWAPLKDGIKSVSLSANWMWPARNPGENTRVYDAVTSVSDFSCDLGINVPTGKDSMSMTQKYPDGKVVFAPGTVIISSVGEVDDIRAVVPQVMSRDADTELLYIDFSDGQFALGGSSFFQTLSKIGSEIPDAADAKQFRLTFNAIQGLIRKGLIISGHDVSAGGMITALMEMCFPNEDGGASIHLNELPGDDPLKHLFSEQPAVIVQIPKERGVCEELTQAGVRYFRIGKPVSDRVMKIDSTDHQWSFNIDEMRDEWYHTSYLFDQKQTNPGYADERYSSYKEQVLNFDFPNHFAGKYADYGIETSREKRSGVKAAIIREKGVNGDREMAYAMHLAGMDVKDVHMTDLISGRETLEDINLIVFVGGFSNSDVLGSAKGWAGAFKFNEQARITLEKYYAREDTLSLGICNGCQLMMEMDLLYPERDQHPRMKDNGSGKFESAFLSVDIADNDSVMLKSLSGSKLGVWVAHGEGKFVLPDPVDSYAISAKYSYSAYPGNPNDSVEDIAAMCSKDGRHLAMMPHLERAFLPWQWAHYPENRKEDEVSPWIEAFVNARNWIVRAQGHEGSGA